MIKFSITFAKEEHQEKNVILPTIILTTKKVEKNVFLGKTIKKT